MVQTVFTVALRTTEGDIFNKDYFQKLFELNQSIRYLPGVNQGSMQSLWTPNVKVMRVTEEGFESTESHSGNLTPEKLSDDEINKIKERILTGGMLAALSQMTSLHRLLKLN